MSRSLSFGWCRRSLSLLAVTGACVGWLASVRAQSPPTFDVTHYGAVGDGRTDCTLAVAHAVDDMLKSTSGGILLFPQGNFLLATAPPAGASAFIDLAPPTPAAGNSAPVYHIKGVTQSICTLVWNGGFGLPLVNVQPATPSEYVSFAFTGLTTRAMNQAAATSTVATLQVNGANNSLIEGNTLNLARGSTIGVNLTDSINSAIRIVTIHTDLAYLATAAVLTNCTNILSYSHTQTGQFLVGYEFQAPFDDISIIELTQTSHATGVLVTSTDPSQTSGSLTIFDAIFDNVATGVSLLNGATKFAIDMAWFNQTASLPRASAGIAIADSQARASIRRTFFSGLDSGIYSPVPATVTVLNSTFELGAVGIEYDGVGAQAVTLNVTDSVFSSLSGSALLLQNVVDIFVASNECSSSSPSPLQIELKCADQTCVVEGNAGCQVTASAHRETELIALL